MHVIFGASDSACLLTLCAL